MTTPTPTPVPPPEKIYAIAERQPEFPCWVWPEPTWPHKGSRWRKWNVTGWRGDEWPKFGFTHWSPNAPEAPTATPQDSVAAEPDKSKIKCPHCGATLLWSEDRGAHCDGCDDFDPENDLPAHPQGQAQGVPEWAEVAANAIIADDESLLRISTANRRTRMACIIAKHAPSQPTEAGLREAQVVVHRPNWEEMDDADLNRQFARAFWNRPIDERNNTYWHDDDKTPEDENHEWKPLPDFCNDWSAVRGLLVASKYVLPVHHGAPKDTRSRCRRAMVDMLVLEYCSRRPTFAALSAQPAKSASGADAKCIDCGKSLNEGEAACFTVCDTCWDKKREPTPAPQGQAVEACAEELDALIEGIPADPCYYKMHRLGKKNLADLLRRHFAPPAAPAGEAAPKDAEGAVVNVRKLAYNFLNMPYHRRMQIAAALGLVEADDAAVADTDMFKAFFRRANEQGKLRDLEAAMKAAIQSQQPKEDGK